MGLRKPVSGGVELPKLTKPAGIFNILSGYDAINDKGERVAGLFTIPTNLPATRVRNYSTGNVGVLCGEASTTSCGNCDITIPANNSSGNTSLQVFTHLLLILSEKKIRVVNRDTDTLNNRILSANITNNIVKTSTYQYATILYHPLTYGVYTYDDFDIKDEA